MAAETIACVMFTAWTDNVAAELRHSGLLLAPAPAERLGLPVLEAMAAGVPIVASASGGHLETIGAIEDALPFPLRTDSMRARMSAVGRRVVVDRFTLDGRVDRLVRQYEAARGGAVPRRHEYVSDGSA